MAPRPTVTTALLLLLLINSVYGFDHLCVDKNWKAGVHPHPTECHKFIECANGIAFEMVCPVGLAFNEQENVCDDPVKLGCDVSGKQTKINPRKSGPTTPRAPPTTPGHLCLDNNWKAGVHPHPTECHKFIECSNGIPYEMICPAGLAFNAQQGVCDDPIKLGCTTYISATTRPSQGNAGPTTTKSPVWKPKTRPPIPTGGNSNIRGYCRDKNLENGIHPHPFECHKFIECSFLKTYIMNCPPGLVFDPKVQTCEPVSVAPPCKTSILPPDGSSVCEIYSLKEGIHPHPSVCNKYIECSNSQTFAMKCPDGLNYHRFEETCDDVHKIKCQDNVDFYKNLVIG